MGNVTADRAGLLRRLGTAVGCGAAGLLLVTGCAAGQNAQTVEQTPSIDGVQAEAGNLAIRAAGIAAPESGASYAKGSSLKLRMVIVNRGAQADKLVSVSSPVAGGAEFSAGSGSSGASSGSSPSASDSSSDSSTSASPSASASSSAAGPGSASATGSTSPSGSASASDSASPSGSGGETSASSSPSASAASTPIDLPSRQSVQIGIGEGGPTVTLTGLNTELFPAQPVPVTLTFSSGASVTVIMAVQLTSEAPTAPTVSVATQPSEPS